MMELDFGGREESPWEKEQEEDTSLAKEEEGAKDHEGIIKENFGNFGESKKNGSIFEEHFQKKHALKLHKKNYGQISSI